MREYYARFIMHFYYSFLVIISRVGSSYWSWIFCFKLESLYRGNSCGNIGKKFNIRHIRRSWDYIITRAENSDRMWQENAENSVAATFVRRSLCSVDKWLFCRSIWVFFSSTFKLANIFIHFVISLLIKYSTYARNTQPYAVIVEGEFTQRIFYSLWIYDRDCAYVEFMFQLNGRPYEAECQMEEEEGRNEWIENWLYQWQQIQSAQLCLSRSNLLHILLFLLWSFKYLRIPVWYRKVWTVR